MGRIMLAELVWKVKVLNRKSNEPHDYQAVKSWPVGAA
jgi:hypothetical protein